MVGRSIFNSSVSSACSRAIAGGLGLVMIAALVVAPLGAASKKDTPAPVPIAIFDGKSRIEFVRTIASERDLRPTRGFFSKVIDFVAGAPEWHNIVRPYAVATDAQGRILITDPGAQAVHIFDFARKKYKLLHGSKKEEFRSPIGIALDADGNIYVSDSELGKIFVFNPNGDFKRLVGDVKGEGLFKRATGIAIDKRTGTLFITDTLRHRVFISDLLGNIRKSLGERGADPGQFNYPTDLRVDGNALFVVDAMNFRIQVFDLEGNFKYRFGSLGDSSGAFFRPKGVALDSHNYIFVVESAREEVQIFNAGGEFLSSFGRTGARPGEFELPSGIWIDSENRIFIADSYNHRVQVLRFVAPESPRESTK